MKINIKEMSTKDLKVLAYDELVVFEKAQQNLQQINQEIASRGGLEREEVKDVVEVVEEPNIEE